MYENRCATTANGTQAVPIRMSEYLRRLLEAIFDSRRRIFIPNSDPKATRRFILRPQLTPQARGLRVCIGRIIALALRENCGHFLIKYLPTEASGTGSVFDTIFFGSWDIRSGFYDVYHDNTLEHMFNNNGRIALMAFHGLGREATI